MASVTTDRLNGVTASLGIKAPVRVATTANITLSGLQTIDDVPLAADDRVLVKDQTDSVENGLYDVKSGSWVRSLDFNGARDVVKGTILIVVEGTANADTFWRVTSANDAVIGTDAITFALSNNQLSGVSAFMEDVLDDEDAAAARATLGAGTGDGTGTLDNLVEDTTPQLGGTLDCNGNQIRWSKGQDVASAAALTLGADGNYFDITGATTITSIATLAVGTAVKLHFDGALTLTHDGTVLILPGGGDITTAAGDEAEFIEYASGSWRCTAYTKADGTAIAAAATAGTLLDFEVLTSTSPSVWTKGADTNNVFIMAVAGGNSGERSSDGIGGTGSTTTFGDFGEVTTGSAGDFLVSASSGTVGDTDVGVGVGNPGGSGAFHLNKGNGGTGGVYFTGGSSTHAALRDGGNGGSGVMHWMAVTQDQDYQVGAGAASTGAGSGAGGDGVILVWSYS